MKKKNVKKLKQPNIEVSKYIYDLFRDDQKLCDQNLF